MNMTFHGCMRTVAGAGSRSTAAASASLSPSSFAHSCWRSPRGSHTTVWPAARVRRGGGEGGGEGSQAHAYRRRQPCTLPYLLQTKQALPSPIHPCHPQPHLHPHWRRRLHRPAHAHPHRRAQPPPRPQPWPPPSPQPSPSPPPSSPLPNQRTPASPALWSHGGKQMTMVYMLSSMCSLNVLPGSPAR